MKRLWSALFSLWLVLLSGVFSSFISPTTPGVLQAFRLQSLLDSKREEVSKIEDEMRRLADETARLQSSPRSQEREIRRVLGYAANDEMIFLSP